VWVRASARTVPAEAGTHTEPMTMQSMKIRTLLLTLLITIPLLAQTPPREFANGPAKWLMTSEEQRAWRSVKTDEQAIDFIDLFWARRDPTPGTGRNENRLEFESRVRYADQHFKERNTRGSLTERGRVLILLGFPKELANAAISSSGQFSATQGANANDPTGGRQTAARDIWTYDHDESAKYNMPKIEVVFVYDMTGDRVRRDPQRTDFTSALPDAIKYYIKSPELTTVPDWASSRTHPDVIASQSHIETTITLEKKKGGQILVDVPAAVAKPAGVGRMMLLHDSMALQPQSGADPFAAVTSVGQFQKGHDLGWAAEYCSGQISENAPSLKVQLKVTASNGDSFSTDPEEFVPDSIRSSPGCYLLRGSLPLTDMDPGPYKVSLTISGTAGGQSYNLVRDFTVQ
jgi:GWxTD domain-containing protein